MKPDPHLWQLGLISLLWLTPNSPISAQIIRDTTLPNNSVVTPNGNLIELSGGTRNGGNLFHSFQEFSVPTNGEAFFNNAPEIQNILTRVTGSKISNIDGLIRANGEANLFLLNPNGIIFGPNAQLNIGGSFIGSTASSIRFADGSEFSAVNPSAPPLLTINVPIGLQFGSNPGRIINQSTALGEANLPPLPQSIPIDNKVGLAVQPGKTLALVGGDIQLAGGNLTASSGQILLGSVASPGLVSFETTAQGLNLKYDNIQNFGKIEISGGSRINTSGIGGGRVEIKGGLVTLSNGQIYGLTLGNIDGQGIEISAQQLRIQNGSQISTIALANGKGGDINIRATDSVEMSGLGFASYQQFLAQYLITGTTNLFDPNFVLRTGTTDAGNAGKIEIETGNLLLRDGAIAASTTLGAGNSGNLTIKANVMEMVGAGINTGTLRGSSGSGGNIAITTQKLIVRDGSGLASTSNSTGGAGNITIQATESVELRNSLSGTVLQTLIGTNALDPNGIGGGGDITIDTKRLIATDGAGITTATGGHVGDTIFSITGGKGGDLTIRATESVELAGISQVLANGSQSASFLATDTSSSSPAGNIYISTPVVTLRKGGVISAASLGTADAGYISINANRVEVIGSGSNGQFISKIEASVGILGNFTNLNATGTAGSVNLNVGQLTVKDGAGVTVQALGKGQAGSINVVGNAIALDNKGSINASTASGEGGNINLQSREILLRRGSLISTNAGNTTGGNIKINTDTLVALPNENSDITANAQKGSGGRISITAQGIFGTQYRATPTSLSDITATSDLGPQFNGTVQINIQGVDPDRGLVELPKTLADSSHQITQTCASFARNNSFIITGRGGLPPTPSEALNAIPGWIDWRVSATGEKREQRERETAEPSTRQSLIQNPQSKIQNPLVEATDFVKDADGTVRLVANPSDGISSDRYYQQNCR
ncbi:MAG: S-layer family protein [Potamolinea sp.]